jgi:hypothetical protein
MNIEKLIEIRNRILDNNNYDNIEILVALNDLDTLIYNEKKLPVIHSSLLLKEKNLNTFVVFRNFFYNEYPGENYQCKKTKEFKNENFIVDHYIEFLETL